MEKSLKGWWYTPERRGTKVRIHECELERAGITVKLQRAKVEKVDAFKYLGSTILSNGQFRRDVKKRMQTG